MSVHSLWLRPGPLSRKPKVRPVRMPGSTLFCPFPHHGMSAITSVSEIWRCESMFQKGETVDDWTEMITQETFFRATRTSPDRVMDHLIQLAPRLCPDHRTAKMFAGEENGYPVGRLLQFCSLYKGKGEITLYKVIQGRDNLYIVHRAIRVPAFPPDDPRDMTETIKEWARYMRTVKLCDTAVERSCPPQFLQ